MGECERHVFLGALCLTVGGVLIVGSGNNLGASLGDDNLGSGATSILASH